MILHIIVNAVFAMNTIFVLCAISFALSIDYSLGLISTQAYWINTGGAKNLAGLVFGVYDGFTIIMTPLFAWLIDNKGFSYKSVFITCIVFNIVGNTIYSFAHVADAWIMVITGRAIAGVGATCVPLLMMYVADRIKGDEQQKTVGYVKYVVAFSGIIGSILGSAFTYVNVNKIINLYTLVGWVPMCFSTLTLIFVALWTEQKSEKTAKISHGMSICMAVSYFLPIWTLAFVTTFIYWFYMGNAFILGTHFFHVIGDEEDLGNLYYAGLGGFLLSFLIFFFFKKNISSQKGLMLSTIFTIPTVFLFMVQENPMYYVAVASTTFAYGLMIPSINYLNNTLAKNLRGILKGRFGIMVTALSIAQGFARFVGPTLFTFSIPQENTSNCTLDDGEKYITSGCGLHNFVSMSAVYNSVCAILMIICYYYFVKKLEASDKDTSILPINEESSSVSPRSQQQVSPSQ